MGMSAKTPNPTDVKTTDQSAVQPGYKRTEVGVIPIDWEIYRFSDHFMIYAGGDVPKDSFSPTQSKEYPFPIYANAITNRGLYGFTGRKRAKPDSLTITARGYLGHAEYRDEPFFPIVRLLVLEPIGTMDAKYATYAINDRIKFSVESTGVPQLTAPQVGKYAVAAPRILPEQRAIAKVLSNVDRLLASLDKLIAKKRAIKQAAMQQLLTGKTRLPGFESKPELKPTEVGVIPEDWELPRLGDCGIVIMGQSPPGASYNRSGIGSPLLNGPTEFTDRHPVKIQWTTQPVRFCRDGDLLICVRGSSTGRTNYANDTYAIGRGVAAIRAQEDNDTRFLSYRVVGAVSEILASATGSTFPSVDGASFRRISIPLPPPPEQRAIANLLSDMDAEIAALECRRDKTKQIKQGMMQQLLTGRIRLVKPEAQE